AFASPLAFLRGRLPLDLHRRLAHIIRLVVFRLAPVLFRSKPPGGELPAEGFRALPLRRAKLASCVSSCVLSMALDSADSPTADCGRTIRREISRTLASSRARASACA
ncbi:MAG: hypothetical protein Q3X05_12055, partial [Bilophila sp.]|nr:hypothetical protein [Bilophila sp.]